MAPPIGVYQGETFKDVMVFKEFVLLSGEIGTVVMPLSEVPCLSGEMCKDTECRHHIDLPDLDNCLLNTDREFTLEEMGGLMGGISRERVRQLVDGREGDSHHRQVGALAKFGKQFKREARAKTIQDVMPDPEIPLLTVARSDNQRAGRKVRR